MKKDNQRHQYQNDTDIRIIRQSCKAAIFNASKLIMHTQNKWKIESLRKKT